MKTLERLTKSRDSLRRQAVSIRRQTKDVDTEAAASRFLHDQEFGFCRENMIGKLC